MHGDLTGGWGSIPVQVTSGETTWTTSIFWTKEGSYILPLKQSVRKAEHIKEGGHVEILFRDWNVTDSFFVIYYFS